MSGHHMQSAKLEEIPSKFPPIKGFESAKSVPMRDIISHSPYGRPCLKPCTLHHARAVRESPEPCLALLSVHMMDFGTGKDGVKRTCAMMKIQAGFKWTECMPADKGGPMPAGVSCCPKTHFGYICSGKVKTTMVETGETKTFEAGEAYYIGPQHDTEVLEDTTMVEFESSAAEFYGNMEAKK